jgi:hypothetical protein
MDVADPTVEAGDYIPTPQPVSPGVKGTGDPQDQDRYPGMTREQRDDAIVEEMSEPVDPKLLQEGIRKEEEKVAKGIARANKERQAKYDPKIRKQIDPISGELELGEYPEEVELWVERNQTQDDLKRKKMAGGDVPADREIESDMALWALGQRKRRDQLAGISEGSSLRGEAANEFAYWKVSGGKWNKPYGSVSREAIRAAQNYYLQFGKPKGIPQPKDVIPFDEKLMAQIEDGTLEGSTPLSIPESESGPSRGPKDRRRDLDRSFNRIANSLGLSEEEKARMYYRDGKPVSDGEFRENYRALRDRALARKSRPGKIARVLQRETPDEKRALLERINRRLPPSERIRPDEVGLPAAQSRGALRKVESISDVSMQSSMPGEYLETNDGIFLVSNDRQAVRVQRMPSGSYVPDADSLSFEDFKKSYTPAMKRSVSQDIRRLANSEDSSFSRRATKLSTTRSEIRNSDRFTEKEKEEALGRIQEEEIRLHYDYLQDLSPGTANPQPIIDLPPMTSQEKLLFEKTASAMRANQNQGDSNSGEGFQGGPGTPIGESEAVAASIGRAEQSPLQKAQSRGFMAFQVQGKSQSLDEFALAVRENWEGIITEVLSQDSGYETAIQQKVQESQSKPDEFSVWYWNSIALPRIESARQGEAN